MASNNMNNKKGIDIEQALEILSARATESDTHPENHNVDGGGCHHPNTPKEATNWGQRIDLNGDDDDNEETTNENAAAAAISEQEIIEQRKKQLDEERSKRQKEIQARLNSLSVKDLIQCVLNSQEERVVTYRKYDRGLEQVLSTGNMTHYPTYCAEATASFSVLSDTINEVNKVLTGKHKRSELTSLIKKLQQLEKEKLNLTAALHLERIRAQNQQFLDRQHQQQQQQQQSEDDKVAEADNRISSLLEQGVKTLQERISSTVQTINETLEELRFFVMEEESDD